MEYERTSPARHPGRWAVIVVLAVAALGIFLLQHSVFVVRTVTVEGATRYTPQDVVRIAGIHDGQNVFTLDQQEIAQNLSQDQYLLLDSIYINYPNELILRVRERKPRAALTWMGVLVMLDEEGRVLETSNQLDARLQIPVVTGMEVTSMDVGMDLATRDPAQVRAMNAMLNELALQKVSALVSELNVANLDNLYLVTQEGMKVMLGDLENLEAKLGLARAVLDELRAGGIQTGSIDVSTTTVADYREVPIMANPYLPEATAVPKELVGI
jgi:cell division protein FtsQ